MRNIENPMVGHDQEIQEESLEVTDERTYASFTTRSIRQSESSFRMKLQAWSEDGDQLQLPQSIKINTSTKKRLLISCGCANGCL